MATTIGVLNRSRKVTATEARRMTRACQIQVTRHAAPVWECVPCKVRFFKRKRDLPKRSIAIIIFDKPDHVKAYGYHSEDKKGRRFGRVFVNPTLEHGGSILGKGNSVSVTLSHEVLEAYLDPDCNLWAEDQSGLMWAYEICDPVESSSYTIRVGKHRVGVSNFVHSTWFDAENPRGTQFDHMRVTTKPFRVAPDGSAVTWDGKEEDVVYGRSYPAWRKRGKKSKLARTRRRGVKIKDIMG